MEDGKGNEKTKVNVKQKSLIDAPKFAENGPNMPLILTKDNRSSLSRTGKVLKMKISLNDKIFTPLAESSSGLLLKLLDVKLIRRYFVNLTRLP